LSSNRSGISGKYGDGDFCPSDATGARDALGGGGIDLRAVVFGDNEYL